MEQVVLLDKNNNKIGIGEKIRVHEQGKLHMAFSIFIFNSKGELLLQKRSKNKYHSGGLWSNTCCSHPRPGENIEGAAHRRLKEEMGFDCELEKVFSFNYNIQLGNLFENEFDCVFIGKFNGSPVINSEEAEDWKWISMDELKKELEKNPWDYSYWFKVAFPRIISFLGEK